MTDPLKSAGARLERKAVRAFLRRLSTSAIKGKGTAEEIRMCEFILHWVIKRQTRYDKVPGGL